MPIVTCDAARAQRPWLDEVSVVLFDLDGTLHDDPRSTERYTDCLSAALGSSGDELAEEVEAVVAGRHPALAPGRFVDPGRGLVLHAPNWVVRNATDWQGSPVPIPDDLQAVVAHDGPLRYLGDRWQIVAALAARRGADPSMLRAAFSTARELVNHHATDLARLACLDDLLDRLSQGRHLMLATNTSEELGRPLVERLAFGVPFSLVRYDARKPEGCMWLVGEAHQRWGARPQQVLVVGDNIWNDLVAPAQSGCRTAHIDPLNIDPAGKHSSVRYPDLAAFAADILEDARA